MFLIRSVLHYNPPSLYCLYCQTAWCINITCKPVISHEMWMSCPTECKFSVHINVRNTLKCAQINIWCFLPTWLPSLCFICKIPVLLSICLSKVGPLLLFICLSVVDPLLVLLSICLSKVCPLLIILSICLSREDLFLITLNICPSRVGPVLVFFSICLSGVSYRYLPCFFSLCQG